MGMAGTRGSGGGGGSSKKKNSKKGLTTAASSVAAPSFDASASLLRLEKTYDRLLLEASKRQLQLESDDDDFEYDDATTSAEYVIAARDGKVLPDWVPVAQLIVVNVDDDGLLVQAGVSSFCREIHHVAGLACNTFRSIPRQGLEYSVEPAESFYKFVYDAVVERSASSDASLMTMAEARRVLGINTNDASTTAPTSGTHAELKRQYRARAFECHPDRIRHAAHLDDAAREQSALEYAQVQLAYETLLGSGFVRREGRTWYESLGGKERTEFRPTGLLPLRQAEQRLQGTESAVMGLDPQLVQSFVARSLASKQQS